MFRRCFNSTVALLAAGFFIAATASAAYPERPIRMIALNPPGGVSDTCARTVGEKLTDRWGRQVVVDNRVGASGIIGSEIAAKAEPDGYTLLLGFIGNLSIGILAPAGTPPAIVKKLNAEIVDILNDAGVQQRLDRAGLIPAPSTPGEFAKLIGSETVRWAKVIQRTGAKVD